MSKKRGKTVGGTIGGILVGFDQQVFRTQPPPHELVVKGSPVRGLSGQDPKLEVVFPDDVEAAAATPADGPKPIPPPEADGDV
jgi:hypothetical protein